MSTAACGLFPSVGNPHYKTNLVANYMKFLPRTPKSSSKSQYIFGLSLKLVKQKGIINEGKLVIRSACSILLLKINWLLLCLDVAAGSPWEVQLENASGKHHKSVHSIIQKQHPFAYVYSFCILLGNHKCLCGNWMQPQGVTALSFPNAFFLYLRCLFSDIFT